MHYKELWEEYLGAIEDPALLREALTHSSCTRDDETIKNNERLEFLGDAVLKLTMTKYLYNIYADKQEGLLTKYRANLISDKLLASMAKKLELADKIYIGSTVFRDKMPDSIQGDALEALIGAIYINKGFDLARDFILDLWMDDIPQAIKDSIEQEYKSRLQELVQEKYKKLPHYVTLSSSGPDHYKEFEIGVYLDSKLLGRAKAYSKKVASQNAAKQALVNKDTWLK